MKRKHDEESDQAAEVDQEEVAGPGPSTSTEDRAPDTENQTLLILVENDMKHGLQPRNEKRTRICRLTSNLFWTCSSVTNYLACSLTGILQSVEQQLPVLLSWSSQQMFTEHLTDNDKYQLLKATWADLMVFAAAIRSIETPNQLKLANTTIVTEEDAKKGGIDEMLKQFHSLLVEPFRTADMQPIEQAVLRAMIFFNPLAQGLENRRQVRKFRDELGEHLYAYSVLKEGESMMRCPTLMSLMDTTCDFAKRCVQVAPMIKLSVEDSLNKRLTDLVQRGIWPVYMPYFAGPPPPE